MRALFSFPALVFPLFWSTKASLPQEGFFIYPDSAQKTAGYDRVATMFSPKGRLYQVEYASKIVEQGTLGVGIVFKDGVLLGADKFVSSKLLLPSSVEKLFRLDLHLGAISAGLVGDARRLVGFARERAQTNRMLYDEPIHVETLVKEVAGVVQLYTQYGGMRPFGVSFIFGGCDDTGFRIFETEPSGALAEYKAVAIGKNRNKAMEVLQKGWSEKLSQEGALTLLFKAIDATRTKEDKPHTYVAELAVIDKKGFRSLPVRSPKARKRAA